MQSHKLIGVLLGVTLLAVGGVAATGATPNEAQSTTQQFSDGTNDSRALNVSIDSARQTAQAELAASVNWTLERQSVHEDDGYYRFRFVGAGTDDTEAEVRVDGSSGDAFRVEQEIENPEHETDERETERDDECDDENGQEDEHENETEQEDDD